MKVLIAAIAIAYFCVSSVAGQTSKEKTVSDASADRLAAAKAAIAKGNAQWSEGWAKGDAVLVGSIFENDGVQLASSGKVIRGRQQIMERQRSAMAAADPGVKVTATTTDVWLVDDLAYEAGKYKYEYSVKGKPGIDEGRYVTVWRQQKDGGWKLIMDMGVPQN